MRLNYLALIILVAVPFAAFPAKLKVVNGCTIKAGTSCKGMNLSGAKLAGANLTGSDFSGANLSGARLTNAKLLGANLSQANLSRANLTGANLTGANLKEATLDGANLSNSKLVSANLQYASLSGSNLKASKLNSADLYGAKLTRANLAKSILTGANLTSADTSGANKSGAKMSGVITTSTVVPSKINPITVGSGNSSDSSNSGSSGTSGLGPQSKEKQDQYIYWGQNPEGPPLDLSIPAGGSATLTVSSTSGLAVKVISRTKEKCRVSGYQVQAIDQGLCVLVATQDGDQTFNPAHVEEGVVIVQDSIPPPDALTYSISSGHIFLSGKKDNKEFHVDYSDNPLGEGSINIYTGSIDSRVRTTLKPNYGIQDVSNIDTGARIIIRTIGGKRKEFRLYEGASFKALIVDFFVGERLFEGYSTVESFAGYDMLLGVHEIPVDIQSSIDLSALKFSFRFIESVFASEGENIGEELEGLEASFLSDLRKLKDTIVPRIPQLPQLPEVLKNPEFRRDANNVALAVAGGVFITVGAPVAILAGAVFEGVGIYRYLCDHEDSINVYGARARDLLHPVVAATEAYVWVNDSLLSRQPLTNYPKYIEEEGESCYQDGISRRGVIVNQLCLPWDTTIGSVTTESGGVGEKTVVLIKGQDLGGIDGLGVQIEGCDDLSLIGVTDTERRYNCVPKSAGTKRVTITAKTASHGNKVTIHNLVFYEISPELASQQPYICDKDVGLEQRSGVPMTWEGCSRPIAQALPSPFYVVPNTLTPNVCKYIGSSINNAVEVYESAGKCEHEYPYGPLYVFPRVCYTNPDQGICHPDAFGNISNWDPVHHRFW